MTRKDAAAAQHEIIGVSRTDNTGFEVNKHKEAQWFKSGNLGLFLHWGICTVHGDIDLSWGMMANKPYELLKGYNKFISPNEYFALCEKFNPDNFNIGHTLKLAKEAGFTYAVFTTKHHDGFALWPSEYGDFNVGKTNAKKDFVKEFVNACRENDLKVGLYYSPPDWHFFKDYMSFNYLSHMSENDFKELDHSPYDTNHKPTDIKEPPQELIDAHSEYVKNHITELLSNYGRVDMLWFDGANGYECISVDEIRKMQPHILINPRLHKKGDFETFECRMPDKKPDGIWEHEDIWADGPWWADMKDVGYKSAEWAYERFSEVKKMGGNFLLNIGLRADGSIPSEAERRLTELADLMKCRKEENYDRGRKIEEC